jgi:hypothetical protein
MATLVTTVGFGATAETSMAVKRPTTVLSDGSFAMLIVDRNQSGVTGDGGDGTNVGKFKIYHSTDAVTWTLKNTITPTTPIKTDSNDGLIAAFCSGVANDNLHIAFVANDGSIRYYRLTWASGPTWTVGSQETAWAAPGGDPDGWRRLDMDIMNQASGAYTGDCVVLGAYWSDILSPYYLSMATGVRRLSDNTWISTVPKVWATAGYAYPYFWDITLACELNGADATTRKGMVAGVFGWGLRQGTGGAAGTGSDEDHIYHFEVNCDTGAITNYIDHKKINAGLGSFNRHYWVFSTGDGDFSFIGAIGTTGMKMYHYKVEFAPDTASNSFWIKIAEGLSESLGDYPDINAYGIRGMGRTAFWGQALENKTTGGGLLVRNSSGVRVFGVREVYVPGGTWTRAFPTTTPIYLDGLRKVSNNNVKWIWAGNNRNKQLDKIPVLEYFGEPTDTWQVWGHNIAEPLAPANVVPAANSSIVTSTPVLKASYRMPIDGVEAYVKMEWELDTSSGFASPDKVLTQSDSKYVIANGTKTQGANVVAQETLPTADAIVGQGTWYVRARSFDEYGRYGPWSAVNLFTVSHPPTAQIVAPAANAFVPQASTIRFDWNFSDPAVGDSQTAEQVLIVRTDTGATVHDSGKVSSTSTYRDIAISNSYLDVPLSWKVRLWDEDDVVGPYSAVTNFTVGAPATVAVTSPTEGSTVTTANPTVSVNVVNGGNRVNVYAQLKVSQAGVTIYTSPLKYMVSPAEDDQFTMQIPTGILLNSQTYTVRVQVWDTMGLTASDSKSFLTSWAPPQAPVFAVSTAPYATMGYTRVTWTNSTIDLNFSSYRVYRREAGTTTWVLIDEQTSNTSNYAFDDWLAGSNVTYEYSVTQVINYYGSIVESIHAPIEATGVGSDYWLIHPTDITKNILLIHVTGDDYTEQYEQESYTVIGRGRHVDYGQRLGYAGSLSAQLRDVQGGLTAREQKKELERLKAERTFVYLRNPFGDVWKVATGNLSISRLAGMGTYEFVDVEIPYEEVAF